jgi:type I restriction enzyme R subunit
VRRNLFAWKHEQVGNLEAKIHSFCAIPQLLSFLQHFIVFAEKDEELNKYILRQHQTTAVAAVVERCLCHDRTRALIWYTQGSGKTFTMIHKFQAMPADLNSRSNIDVLIDSSHPNFRPS